MGVSVSSSPGLSDYLPSSSASVTGKLTIRFKRRESLPKKPRAASWSHSFLCLSSPSDFLVPAMAQSRPTIFKRRESLPKKPCAASWLHSFLCLSSPSDFMVPAIAQSRQFLPTGFSVGKRGKDVRLPNSLH